MKRATIVFDKERSKNENFDAKQTKSKTNFPVAFGINDRISVFHRPHPQKETDKGALVSVRRFLEEAGVKTMKYKEYRGQVNYDEEAKLFHGEVIGLRDVITFQGTSVDELEQAFKDSVDEYLDFCKELGRPPEKPFSGKLVLRLTPEIHERAAYAAKSHGLSLNAWLKQGIQERLSGKF